MSDTFGNYLKRKLHEWQGKKLPERPSQADWAVWLGVKTTTLSTWMNDQKVPTDAATIDKLADKLGLEVYDILGVSRRLSRKDRKLTVIAAIWDRLPENLQNQWYEMALNYKERQEAGDEKTRA